jgi:hypothetical protein
MYCTAIAIWLGREGQELKKAVCVLLKRKKYNNTKKKKIPDTSPLWKSIFLLVESVFITMTMTALSTKKDLQIIWRDSADKATYEDARVGRVFNHRRPHRFPLAVVKASSVDDIQAAVKLAIEKNCRVAVRSGGHSWAVWSVRDQSILIDLGNYKELEVDEENRLARATPSVTGKELNGRLISEYGLMFPGGHCPDVGLGGFLLQGGMGWNCRVCLREYFH